MPTINLPIFVLPVFLLPQGLTRLRIFEPRYLKMVAVATKNNGFVIVPGDQEESESPIGSWVDIINFDQSDDGQLLIDVRCKCLVDVKEVTQDSDNLHHGNVSIKMHWPEVNLDQATSLLAKSLSKVFVDNEELNELYPQQYFDKANWVVARWLELLPVNLDEKRLFADKNSFSDAKLFLQNIIFPE